MNKIALSLLSILVLAVHVNWRDSTLFRSFHGAQRSATAIALTKLTIADVRFADGFLLFPGMYQGGLQDCNEAPRTPEDLKRSEEDPGYWDRQVQECSKAFFDRYDNMSLMDSLLSNEAVRSEARFEARVADIGILNAVVRPGAAPFKDTEGCPQATLYLSLTVSVDEPGATP